MKSVSETIKRLVDVNFFVLYPSTLNVIQVWRNGLVSSSIQNR